METTNIENAQTLEEVTDEVKKTVNPQRPMNRAQRRAAAKRAGRKGRAKIDLVTETATHLNYIDLIQKLRKLNERKEEENNNEDSTEHN